MLDVIEIPLVFGNMKYNKEQTQRDEKEETLHKQSNAESSNMEVEVQIDNLYLASDMDLDCVHKP